MIEVSEAFMRNAEIKMQRVDELEAEIERAYANMVLMQVVVDAASLASDSSEDHLMVPERHNELMTALAELHIYSVQTGQNHV